MSSKVIKLIKIITKLLKNEKKIRNDFELINKI
jgi:hypothetical protein